MNNVVTKSSMVGNVLFRRLIVHWSKSYSENTEFGAVTKNLKVQIFDFFDRKCAYCNKNLKFVKTHWDHAIPINKTCFGLNVFGNIVPTHPECNALKHNKTWDEYFKENPNPVALRKLKKYLRTANSKNLQTVLPEKFRSELVNVCDIFSENAADQINVWRKCGENYSGSI